MRIYYDTEFTNLDGNAGWDLISAGFVAEDGQEWYVEIEDFDRQSCSAFVVETVLPLLGKGDLIPERMPAHHFAWRMGNWLEKFGEPIQLVSDSACDWHLINGYCHTEFSTFPVKIQGQIWVRSDQIEIQQALDEFEAAYWGANPGMNHHGLYDARRLKLIAEEQKRLLTQ